MLGNAFLHQHRQLDLATGQDVGTLWLTNFGAPEAATFPLVSGVADRIVYASFSVGHIAPSPAPQPTTSSMHQLRVHQVKVTDRRHRNACRHLHQCTLQRLERDQQCMAEEQQQQQHDEKKLWRLS